MIYGYARVSTTEQETTLQLDALRRSGVETIPQDKRSSVGQRPKLMETLEPGDMVKVYKIDRLARSLMDLLSILDRIQKVGASFQSLTEPVDTSTSAGRMMTHMLGAFAEFERGIIRERSIAGQTAAMMRGIHCGRPRSVAPEDEKEIVRLWQSNQYTMDSLAAIFNVHPSSVKRSIYRVLKPGHSSLR
ncbi:recombinase family protein [Polaromonas sp.]|uniref:recombinase family protein n=1 Tax=Polaromonas sp. TaxID=1869339 RepID=UPI003C996CAA